MNVNSGKFRWYRPAKGGGSSVSDNPPFSKHWSLNVDCQKSLDTEIWLVGLEHVFFLHILGMSSSQLTFTPSFFRGVGQATTNQR